MGPGREGTQWDNRGVSVYIEGFGRPLFPSSRHGPRLTPRHALRVGLRSPDGRVGSGEGQGPDPRDDMEIRVSKRTFVPLKPLCRACLRHW